MRVHRYRARHIRSVFVWVVAVVSLFGLIAFTSEAHAKFTCDTDPHTVQYGETLWAIAEAKCDGNIQHITHNLASVYGTTIHTGDTIWLPMNDDCLLENRGGHIYDSCG